MKRWEENNGVYKLIITPYYKDLTVLQFYRDVDEDYYWYESEDILRVKKGFRFFNNIDEAKEIFENMIKDELENEIDYYTQLLKELI